KVDTKSQLDPAPGAPAGPADSKQSSAAPGKANKSSAPAGQLAVSPADLAAEGLPSTKGKKPGRKPEPSKLASERGDGKPKKSTGKAAPASPTDRAADEPSRAKSRARTLRDLSAGAPQKEAR